jgi:hypothetical protein
MSRIQKVLIVLGVIAAILLLDMGGYRSDFVNGWRDGMKASSASADSTR